MVHVAEEKQVEAEARRERDTRLAETVEMARAATRRGSGAPGTGTRAHPGTRARRGARARPIAPVPSATRYGAASSSRSGYWRALPAVVPASRQRRSPDGAGTEENPRRQRRQGQLPIQSRPRTDHPLARLPLGGVPWLADTLDWFMLWSNYGELIWRADGGPRGRPVKSSSPPPIGLLKPKHGGKQRFRLDPTKAYGFKREGRKSGRWLEIGTGRAEGR